MKNLAPFVRISSFAGCLLSFFLLSSALTSGPEAVRSGKISGRITYEGKLPAKKAIDMSGFPDCAEMNKGQVYAETLLVSRNKGLANALVRIVNPPKQKYPTPSQTVELDFQGCKLSPQVNAVMVNQAVRFKNSDRILHNVHGLPKVNKSFNIGMPPSAKPETLRFASPEGPFKVKCDVHPWVNAYIAVMTHPYFAVTDQNGQFSFEGIGLKAGVVYEIEVAHTILGSRKGKITVGDGETQFNFSYN